MNNKLKKFFIMSAVCTWVMTSSISINAAPNKNRLSGNNRYQTCKSIVEKGWKESKYAVIATGKDYPDALSAAVIAKKYNAPLILTDNNKLSNEAKYELERLNVKNVYIIGGKSAIGDEVIRELDSMSIVSVRLGGVNRFETCANIAQNLDPSNGIFVTTGLDFADALSVSSIAAKKGMPIILVSKDRVDNSVLKYIKDKNISKTYIVGSNSIISDGVANKFPNVERIVGNTKCDRNIAVLNKFSKDIDIKNVYVATVRDYPDALAGSALAALNSSPIILVDNNLSNNTLNYFKNNIKNIGNINILGGNAAVNGNLINKITDTYKNTQNGTQNEAESDTQNNTDNVGNSSEFRVESIQ